MQQLYDGPKAETIADLAAYTGEAAADRLVGGNRRAGYLLNYRQLGINYGENVEFQLRREQVILCPQTVGLLYGQAAPIARYEPGTRPELEEVVLRATSGGATQQEKVLVLMHFCRDLRQTGPVAPWTEYVFGGTEEEMIAKPEILCETLGRLLVALCEVAGIPARLVMHDLGGHICTEALVDGHWGYIDPRCGIYFRKEDGALASVWELWQNPEIIYQQSDEVKKDVSDQWSWSLRAWKCARMYFAANEVNGFQLYSLADASRFNYGQKSYAQAEADGLMDVNAEYVRTAQTALGLSIDARHVGWQAQTLKTIDIANRNDGFTHFFGRAGMTKETLLADNVDPLEGGNAGILVWGLGPGSVFCYETKVGQIFGAGLTEEQRSLLRSGDLEVHENVMSLIEEGPGPLAMAIERAHEHGFKILARLEMNHEYGPPQDDNWMWVAFVGDLNKQHPEYRIPESVLLDFKHPEVRDFKLAILREAAAAGCDGVSMDFAVYPPFFEVADPDLMTQFVADVRAMLDEVGQQQGRRLELMARVPACDSLELGLDWRAWMEKGLVDYMAPTHRHAPDYFDIRVEEFVAKGVETGVKVYPTIWQALGFVDTDPRPGDESSGMRRYDKPKTRGMFCAQAMLCHRAGVDGVQLGFGEDQFRTRPWLNDLADPDKLIYADKHYMVDPIALRPGTFELGREGHLFAGERRVGLRLGDDTAAAMKAGYRVSAEIVVYCRPLEEGERLSIHVNGNGPVEISGDSEQERARRGTRTFDPGQDGHEEFKFEREWWQRGEHKLALPAQWWQLQDNEIELVYSTPSEDVGPPLSVTWIDLLLNYEQAQQG